MSEGGTGRGREKVKGGSEGKGYKGRTVGGNGRERER